MTTKEKGDVYKMNTVDEYDNNGINNNKDYCYYITLLKCFISIIHLLITITILFTYLMNNMW